MASSPFAVPRASFVTAAIGLAALAGCGSGQGPTGPGASDTASPIEIRRGVIEPGVFGVEFDEPVQTEPKAWTLTANGIPQEFELQVVDRIVQLRPRWDFVDVKWSLAGTVHDAAGNSTAVDGWGETTSGSWETESTIPAPVAAEAHLTWTPQGAVDVWSYAKEGSGITVARLDGSAWLGPNTFPVPLASGDTLPAVSMQTIADGSTLVTWATPEVAGGLRRRDEGLEAIPQADVQADSASVQSGGVLATDGSQMWLLRVGEGGFEPKWALPLATTAGAFTVSARSSMGADVLAVANQATATDYDVILRHPDGQWTNPIRIAGWPSTLDGASTAPVVHVNAEGDVFVGAGYATHGLYVASISHQGSLMPPTRIDIPDDLPEHLRLAAGLVFASAPGHTVVGWLEQRNHSGGVVDAARVVVRSLQNGELGPALVTPEDQRPLADVSITVDALGRIAVAYRGETTCVARFGGAWDVSCNLFDPQFAADRPQLAAHPSGRLALTAENTGALFTRFR